MSKRKYISVVEGRVRSRKWGGKGLSGTVTVGIRALLALTFLDHSKYNLSGSLPHELVNLTSLTILYLHDGSLSGTVPSSLARLTNFRYIFLHNNNFTTDILPDDIYKGQRKGLDLPLIHLPPPYARYVITCIFATNRRPPCKPHSPS